MGYELPWGSHHSNQIIITTILPRSMVDFPSNLFFLTMTSLDLNLSTIVESFLKVLFSISAAIAKFINPRSIFDVESNKFFLTMTSLFLNLSLISEAFLKVLSSIKAATLRFYRRPHWDIWESVQSPFGWSPQQSNKFIRPRSMVDFPSNLFFLTMTSLFLNLSSILESFLKVLSSIRAAT